MGCRDLAESQNLSCNPKVSTELAILARNLEKQPNLAITDCEVRSFCDNNFTAPAADQTGSDELGQS